ncbi:unnamed protein product [Rotaria magnacalcarata]
MGHSEFSFEEEVLFSLGCAFEVDSCHFDDVRGILCILLIATDNGQELVQTFLTAQNDQLQIYSPTIYFGRLLMNELGQIGTAAEYFYNLLTTLPEDHPDIAEVYNQIGALHYLRAADDVCVRPQIQTFELHKNDFDEVSLVDVSDLPRKEKKKALAMFEKALEIRKKTLVDNDIRIANVMNNIGSIYNDWGEYSRALQYYNQALTIFENLKIENSSFKANVFKNIGIAYERQKQYKTALEYYTRVSKIYFQCLPVQHPYCAHIATQIAQLSEKILDSSIVCKYYCQAYDSYEKMLLPSDKQLQNVWENIIRHSLATNNEEQAMAYLNRVLETCKRFSPQLNATSQHYIQFMAQSFENVLDFNKALEYYRECIGLSELEMNTSMKYSIFPQREFQHFMNDFDEKTYEEHISIIEFKISAYEKLFSCNDLKHASFLSNMPNRLAEYEADDLAYRYFQKAFEMYEALELPNGNEIFFCWKNLVSISFKNKDEQSALRYFERARKKCKDLKNDYPTQIDLACDMAFHYQKMQNISNTLIYYEKAFVAAEAIRSFDIISELLKKLFAVYLYDGQEQTFCLHISRAVNIFEQDPVKLSKIYCQIGDLYEKQKNLDKAFRYYEEFLKATEMKDICFSQVLDQMWTDFVVRMGEHPIGWEISAILRLIRCAGICNLLDKMHYKRAIVLYLIGSLNEKMGFSNRALDDYSEAVPMWEEIVQKKTDARAVTALRYMWRFCNNDLNSLASLLNVGTYKSFWGENTLGIDQCKWQCILQRFKMLKMVRLKEMWRFHIELMTDVRNLLWSGYVFTKMLEVYNEEPDDDKENMSSEETSVICCLEYVSHWYFENQKLHQSLRYRQYQLELEYKNYNHRHCYIGWSLWFIGLVLHKMTEYRTSLGYLTQALKIFEHNYQTENLDIRMLKSHILATSIHVTDDETSEINKSITHSLAQRNREKIKVSATLCAPTLLEKYFHVD